MKGSGLFLVIFSVLSAHVSGGANEPIADNELGLTAKSCAESYCADSGKDGLQLWLSVYGGCGMNEAPTAGKKGLEAGTTQLIDEDKTAETRWSPTTVGSLSAVMASVGLMMGFAQGMKRHT
eukprot:CAMPEP_0171616902 /NCGR_PEP_ID=MMETSP0990-20121206/13767_1 /TAXON_ID=483369 /ORGANISM="non described non described, Strain CCMP2098" /LENGTH=121 /DNA_ID=CAMNT_0012181283 /DNA_START=67 /DNA_END=432 /DNA_ORIENTATION=-